MNQNEFCSVQSVSDMSVPPGFGIVGDPSPSGFEGSAAQNDNIYEEGLARSDRAVTVVGTRMT